MVQKLERTEASQTQEQLNVDIPTENLGFRDEFDNTLNFLE